MPRNLKIFSLGLVIVIAMGAMLASAVSGEIQFTPAQEGGVKQDPVFTTGSRSVVCEFLEFSGPVTASSTMTVTPTFTNCTWGGMPATAAMNGCDYLIHATEHVGEHLYQGSLDLVCPEGKKAELITYASHASHTAGTPVCRLTFPPATGYETVTLKNNTVEGPDDISLNGEVKKLKYEIHGSVLLCGSNTVPKEDGIWHLENLSTGEPLTLTGTNGQGNPVDLRVETVGTE